MTSPQRAGPGGKGNTLGLRIAGERIDLLLAPGLESLTEELRRLWRPLLATGVTTEPAGNVVRLVPDGGPAGSADTVVSCGAGATYVVSGLVTRALIGRLLGRRLLLHAGAVDQPRFGVVLLVGRSGAGKSTATTVLGEQGRYLTDELVILDPETFELAGYPKPVSRVPPDHPEQPKTDVDLRELGLDPGESAGAPDHLVILDRAPGTVAGAHPMGVARMGLGESLLILIEQSSSLWTVPGGLAQLARLVTRCGGALRVGYREAREIPALLAELPSRSSEEWQVLSPLSSGDPAPGSLVVTAYVQALALETGVLILAEHRALHATGLVALVWDLLREAPGSTLTELERRVVEHLDPHPDSAALVRDAVDHLREEGWLRVVDGPGGGAQVRGGR